MTGKETIREDAQKDLLSEEKSEERGSAQHSFHSEGVARGEPWREERRTEHQDLQKHVAVNSPLGKTAISYIALQTASQMVAGIL